VCISYFSASYFNFQTELSSENSTVDEVTDPVAPPVAKTEQVAQHSIVDKFRNFFSVGSKSKSKQKRWKKGQGDRGGEEPFEQIKQQCLEAGTLWEDPCFPACDESLYFQEKPALWPVQWKRPHVSGFFFSFYVSSKVSALTSCLMLYHLYDL